MCIAGTCVVPILGEKGRALAWRPVQRDGKAPTRPIGRVQRGGSRPTVVPSESRPNVRVIHGGNVSEEKLLRVAFCVDLTHDKLASVGRLGPLFKEWLPNGVDSAIQLTPQLRVWFERRLVQRDSFLEWDGAGEAQTSSRLARQAQLSAGPLFGALDVPCPQEGVLSRIREERRRRAVGEKLPVDPVAESFAKTIVRAIEGPACKFVDTLRNEYGQYWLEPWPTWDSRRQSLGAYFSHLNVSVVLPDGAVQWIPTAPAHRLEVSVFGDNHFGELICESDWQSLRERDWAAEPSLVAGYLGRASQQAANGQPRFALLEAANALELSIGQRLQSTDAEFNKHLQRIETTSSLTSRAVLLLTLAGAPSDEIRATIHAVDARNDAFHKPAGRGLDPGEFRVFLRAIARLAGIPTLKQPVLSSGNRAHPE